MRAYMRRPEGSPHDAEQGEADLRENEQKTHKPLERTDGIGPPTC